MSATKKLPMFWREVLFPTFWKIIYSWPLPKKNVDSVNMKLQESYFPPWCKHFLLLAPGRPHRPCGRCLWHWWWCCGWCWCWWWCSCRQWGGDRHCTTRRHFSIFTRQRVVVIPEPNISQGSTPPEVSATNLKNYTNYRLPFGWW